MTRRAQLRRLLPACLAFASIGFLIVATPAISQDYIPLPEKQEIVDIDGESALVRYWPAFALPQTQAGGTIRVPLRVEGDLGELHPIIVKRLARQHHYDECGDRVRAHSIKLKPSGGMARLTGVIHIERWQCVKTQVPEFRGLRITMKTRILKTRVFEQSADMTIDLNPVIERDGQSLRIDAQVVGAKPSSHSLLGRISNVANLESQFMKLTQDAVDKSKDRLRVAFPDEILAYKPQLANVAFTDRGGERLGLIAEGHISITKAQLVDLLAEYAG